MTMMMTAAGGAERRWLFVDDAELFGGHEVMLLRWIGELLQQGDVKPRLLAREGSRLQELAPAPVRCASAFARLRSVWRDAKVLRRTLREERPEWVVFACGALGSQIPLQLLARLWGARVAVYVPLLGSFRSMGYRRAALKDLFVRAVLARLPHAWVAITAQQAQEFRAWARPTGPVHVLPNTVAREIEDAPRLAPAEARGELRVLVLGRLEHWQKGLDLLLDHLEAAPPAALRVSLVGEGPYREVVESRLAASPVLGRCLQLQPWMPARQALASHDLLLLPSRYEGVPLVMLEAMALGLPVIGADLPGLRAYLSEVQLFPMGDMKAAFERVEALRPREVREAAAAAGRAAYEAGASSAAFAAAVAALSRTLDRQPPQQLKTEQLQPAAD
ncbi:glycosyltransferase family 4 protein [Pelomonas sp. KK5]|uniref:glycosyltransferase family 4 protein n=1 Tax=Pelomonas sp. KK5 TaxID=1855730 RepID=UPI0009F908AF|nr:glycosyltransferase family 4 protein [Pelomonas sp. KK5]